MSHPASKLLDVYGGPEPVAEEERPEDLELVEALARNHANDLTQKTYASVFHQKYNPNHDQIGRFASGDAEAGLVAQGQRGGFSIAPVAQRAGHIPKSGWMVSTTGAEKAYSPSTMTPDSIRSYVQEHHAELSRPDHYLGGWLSKEDGKFYLDVSQNVASKDEALQLGAQRNQWGVYNNETRQYVPVASERQIASMRAFKPTKNGPDIIWLDPNDPEGSHAALMALLDTKPQQKFNQNHDERGRFSSGPATSGNTAGEKPRSGAGQGMGEQDDVRAAYNRAVLGVTNPHAAVSPSYSDIAAAQDDDAKVLAERTELPLGQVRDFQVGWKGSETNPDTIAIVEAASRVYGLSNNDRHASRVEYATTYLASGTATGLSSGDILPPWPEMVQRAETYVRAQYALTQEKFAAMGMKPDDTVSLYRGFGRSANSPEIAGVGDDWTQRDIGGRAASSWAADSSIANRFAGMAAKGEGYVAKTDVKVRDVLGTGFTGLGQAAEREYVVLNGNRPAWVRKGWL